MMVNLPCLKGSCPNFLRPTCSYTECRLSFLTGSCPTEGTTASYSSCLYLILLTSWIFKVLIFSGRYTLLLAVGLVINEAQMILRCYRVSYQNPARFQNHLEPSKVLDFLSILHAYYAATGSCSLGRFMSINIFFGSYTVPFVRIV
ncbi:MAG: hypothetical protein PWP24_1814 [Clostridiales bacterium]|nr:hypothetical protein [Clostridiales bacterium]